MNHGDDIVLYETDDGISVPKIYCLKNGTPVNFTYINGQVTFEDDKEPETVDGEYEEVKPKQLPPQIVA